MSDYKDSTFYLECDCGCGTLQIVNTWDKEDVFFNYLLRAYVSHQETMLDKIKKRLSIFWKVVILGKEYILYEIVLSNPEKLQKFKKYVSSLEIKDDAG